MAADPGVDIVVQVSDFTAGPTGAHPRARRPLRSVSHALGTRDELFAILDTVDGAPQASDMAAGLADGVLVLSGMRSGLRALGHLAGYEHRRTAVGAEPPSGAQPTAAAPAPRWTPDVLDLLRDAGFTLVRAAFATSTADAVRAGDELGYPVVVKIADEGVEHKSELGGVLLGLRSSAEVAAAADRLLRRANRIVVQEQICDGTELFLGLQSASGLGTFIVAGLGGIWAELVDDVQVRPVGLRDGEAGQMVRQLRGYARLTGARGRPPVRLDVVIDAISRLDAVGLAVGERIRSLDINPLIIRGDEAIVVDALLIAADPAAADPARAEPAPAD